MLTKRKKNEPTNTEKIRAKRKGKKTIKDGYYKEMA